MVRSTDIPEVGDFAGMKKRRLRPRLQELPLSSAFVASLVFTFLWNQMLLLKTLSWTPGRSSAVANQESAETCQVFAFCAGLFLILLLVQSVIVLLRGWGRRRITVVLDVLAAGLQAFVLAGSLEVRDIFLSFASLPPVSP